MSALEIILGIVLILLSIAIIVLVLLQQGRQAGLSSAIAGGAESFLGKTKGRKIEAQLERITKVIAIVFFVVVLAVSLLLFFI